MANTNSHVLRLNGTGQLLHNGARKSCGSSRGNSSSEGIGRMRASHRQDACYDIYLVLHHGAPVEIRIELCCCHECHLWHTWCERCAVLPLFHQTKQCRRLPANLLEESKQVRATVNLRCGFSPTQLEILCLDEDDGIGRINQ